MMKKLALALAAVGAAVSFGALQQPSDLTAWIPLGSAHAVVGRPLTPVSVAGVARRTTRRMIVATNHYVATLPANCTVVVVEDTKLHLCGSTYYQQSGTQYVIVNVN